MAEISAYHNFHYHLLKPCRPSLVYRENEGLWKCDGCQRQFGDVITTPYNPKMASSFNHCDRCNVDLCEKCFNGKWSHSLHDIRGHELKPVDPRIEYRIHEQWQCNQCNVEYSHSDTIVFFHCACNFDLCSSCFGGQKHHLHQHPLVSVHSKELSNMLRCSRCSTLLNNQGSLFRCYDAECAFQLCNNCFVTPPANHPLHKHHPLEVFDPSQAYPHTGGTWHCNNCTANSPGHSPRPLSPDDTMYHCPKCEYDLCRKCYSSCYPSSIPQLNYIQQWS